MNEIAPFAAFAVATLVGLGLSGLTYLVARRSGLGDVQSALISTLQSNAAALAERVDLLEQEVEKLAKVRSELEAEVKRLRNAVTELVLENSEFRKKLRLPERSEHS